MIHFDEVTSSYINLGPTEPLEMMTTNDDDQMSISNNESFEQNAAKMSAEKIRQVRKTF